MIFAIITSGKFQCSKSQFTSGIMKEQLNIEHWKLTLFTKEDRFGVFKKFLEKEKYDFQQSLFLQKDKRNIQNNFRQKNTGAGFLPSLRGKCGREYFIG